MVEPLISVIIPFYKSEKYIYKCIDSICNQTYKNLEIILIDDGSPDNCGEICDDYARRDSRIVVLHKKNKGVSYARNAGLEIVRGKYVIFIDGDDWVNEDYMESLYKFSNEDVIVMSGATLFDEKTGNRKNIYASTSKITNFNNKELLELVENTLFGFVWNKLYPTKLISDIRFKKISNREDIVFNLYLVAKGGNKYIATDYIGYNWLQRSTSETHKYNLKNINTCLDLNYELLLLKRFFNNEIFLIIYNRIMKTFIADIILKDIFNNSELSIRDKINYIKKLNNKEVRKNLKIIKKDGLYFKILVLCFKMHLESFLCLITSIYRY